MFVCICMAFIRPYFFQYFSRPIISFSAILPRISNSQGYSPRCESSIQELAPSHYFSSTNVHLVDINVFAKFYEIPSLPFQDIEKPKCRRRTNRGTNILGLCGQTFYGAKGFMWLQSSQILTSNMAIHMNLDI